MNKMKILAFSDLHSSAAAIKSIEKKAKSADIIVCAGDFTFFEQGMRQVLRRLNAIGKTVLIVHGNHESEERARASSRGLKNLVFIHKGEYRKNELLFIGYGGGGFSLRDRGLEGFVKKYAKKGKNLIFITHAPPYKTRLDYIYGSHRGCKSTRDFIDKAQPLIVICGHFHETAGMKQEIGKTLVVNAGPKGIILKIGSQLPLKI